MQRFVLGATFGLMVADAAQRSPNFTTTLSIPAIDPSPARWIASSAKTAAQLRLLRPSQCPFFFFKIIHLGMRNKTSRR